MRVKPTMFEVIFMRAKVDEGENLLSMTSSIMISMSYFHEWVLNSL